MPEDLPPPTRSLGVRLNLGVLATSDYAEHLGRAMLKEAEKNRREPGGTFDSAADPGAPPSADWAVAGLIIQGAVTVLDESLPNAQRARSEAALGALVVGTAMLLESLKPRGVMPLTVLLGATDADQTTPV